MNSNDAITPEQRVDVEKRRNLLASSSATSLPTLSQRLASLCSEQGNSSTQKKKRAPKKRKAAENEEEQVEEIQEEAPLALLLQRQQQPVQQWPASALRTVFDNVLLVAGENGFEFDVLRTLARTCKRFSQLYALSPSAPLPLIQRYVDAFMRERIVMRKFQIDDTPTKDSLEPYYHFQKEEEIAQGHLEPYTKTTYTLTAPSVRACWKGVQGVPNIVVSKVPGTPWFDTPDSSGTWERIKTKNWSIRNPLVRLVAMHAQTHAECCHAAAVHEWLETVKTWPLAKQRKPWSALTEWHDKPPTLVLQ